MGVALAAGIKSAGQGAAGRALDLILPPRCPACRDIVAEAGRFCGACWRELSFITAPQCSRCGLPFDLDAGAEALCGACAQDEPPYDKARAALAYEGAAVPVLLGFKHAGRTHLASVMAGQMVRLAGGSNGDRSADLIVPVPLDPARLRKRGYNQAGLLGRALSRVTGIPQTVDAMRRVKPTASTAGLSRSARFRAAAGAFQAARNKVEGARVLLIDDVMTTGATAEAAARALRKAGAREVGVLTYARALSTS